VDRLTERRVTGKLVSLGALLLRDGGKVEADLQQFYGVSLLDLTLRRAWVLIENLPSDARLVREAFPSAEWSTEAHLTAALLDAVENQTWVLMAVNSDPKKKPPPRPKPLPRPGAAAAAAEAPQKKPEGRMVSGDDLAKMLD